MDATDSGKVIEAFGREGFVILPGYLDPTSLRPGVENLSLDFPTAAEFHNDLDPDRNARFRDEFGGISNFPFASVELSLLATHERLIDLAQTLLQTDDPRVYSIEGWAKYTGAADYRQGHHRDYLNHTLLVPAAGDPPDQVEMFVYLSDVTPGLAPTAYVPRTLTEDLPALPNWYFQRDGAQDAGHPTWLSPVARPELFDAEVSAGGPAGTVVAYRIETFHRATAMTEPGGARYTLHVNFKHPSADWIVRHSWTDAVNSPAWHAFVPRATVRQLRLFGFPPPGHHYWNHRTLAGLVQRYPDIDVSAWSQDASGDREAEER